MRYGIIVGTGIGIGDGRYQWKTIQTDYGIACAAELTIENKTVLVMQRHGIDISTPPHLINHRANIQALKQEDVAYIVATAAVGSLRRDIIPGTLGVISDFIEFNKSRINTFFNTIGELHHTDFSAPYSPIVSNSLASSLDGIDCPTVNGLVYMSVDGPRYETPAEVRMFASWGADVVGMTGAPEAILAKELGMEYGSLAIVTNYAAGIGNKALSHDDVIDSVNSRKATIQSVLARAIHELPAN